MYKTISLIILLGLFMNSGCDSSSSDSSGTSITVNGSITMVEPEDPGTNCPGGGIAVMKGVDDNGNNILDDEEIDSTEYICNSANQLVVIENLPAGSPCLEGGVNINVGYDDNFNGVLEISEYDSSTTICNPEITINAYIVATKSDKELLSIISAIWGNLEIIPADPSLTGIGNSSLKQVGTLKIGNFDTWNISKLAAVSLSNVNYIGNIEITYCRDLLMLNLGYISSLNKLLLQVNDSIENLNALSNVTGPMSNVISLSENASLQDISGLSGITSTQALVVDNNDSLASLDGLNNIGTVTTGNLFISNNAILADISALGNITSVGGNVVITNNPVLPTCAANAIVDSIGIENISGTVTISGNDDAGTCD